MIIGNRIPKDYFVTSGIGESSITVHAGSFDAALREAGIHDYNIIRYSSIMPRIAKKVERPKLHHHGAVMEVIMAESNGVQGERVTAGLVIGWIHNKKTGSKYGGLVAEYNGHADEETARGILDKSIHEMFEARFDSSTDFELREIEVILRSFTPRKKFGSAVVAICFTSYEYPEI
jgi:arginine decarboxylase